MSEFWKRHPPLHAMVQGYLGIKSEPEKATNLSELLASVDMRPA